MIADFNISTMLSAAAKGKPQFSIHFTLRHLLTYLEDLSDVLRRNKGDQTLPAHQDAARCRIVEIRFLLAVLGLGVVGEVPFWHPVELQILEMRGRLVGILKSIGPERISQAVA